MVRNVIGSVMALVGATAAVWSPFRVWYDGRQGSAYRVQDLFQGVTRAQTELATSILLPFAFAALVTLIGLVLRSRLLVALAGVIVLGFTVLWMVRQGQAAGSLTVGGRGPALGDGVAAALGGGILLLLAAAVMSGRAPRLERAEEPAPYRGTDGPEPYGWAAQDDETTQTMPLSTDLPRRPRPDPYGAGPAQDPYGTGPAQDPYGPAQGSNGAYRGPYRRPRENPRGSAHDDRYEDPGRSQET
ncbi:hypothetical protein [Streptomyces sp. NPDC059176]|uniref:hypothetical protein n=1 Tax=Streptomyces sp. NPDC059176 TaxID=3346758 RepID=UPI0036C06FF5